VHRLSRHLLGTLVVTLFAVSPALAAADTTEPPPVIAPAPSAATDPATNAQLSAGWLARTLSATADLAQKPDGTPDYAATAYALLGMRAAGVAAGQITKSATAMAASGETFIGTYDQIGQKTTAIALMILAMSAAGFDAAQYPVGTGTRDLYADLDSAIHEDGSVGDMPSAYGQAFAILAFRTALIFERHPYGATGVPEQVVAWLKAQPCTDQASPGYGGYGFSTGSCTDTDPDSTALAVLALVAAGAPSEVTMPGTAYLLTVQDPSGGFVSPFSGVNANTTGLATAALRAIMSYALPLPYEYTSAPEAAWAYLGSLMYGCDQATRSDADLLGAIAYDGATRTAPLTPGDATRAALTQSTAQGIWGLIDPMTWPADYAADAVDTVPDAALCGVTPTAPSQATEPPGTITPSDSTEVADPSTAEPIPPDGPTGGTAPTWPWIAGGVILVAALALVVRLLLVRKH